MSIIIKRSRKTLDAFLLEIGADLIVVQERICGKLIWTADIEESGIADCFNSSCVESGIGKGNTIEESIRDYAKYISGRVLILKVYSEERKQFQVPILKG